ncbi:MAG TPA: ATP-binding protein, partial [Anaerolineales bacterium]|nr:ATP-binding protein [Anaerolineales bacterium]
LEVHVRENGTAREWDLSVTAGPIKDAVTGSIIQAVVTIHDITELKSRQRELQAIRDSLAKSEANYRRMGETLPYGVWMCDPYGKMLHVSQSYLDLMGVNEDDFKQRNAWMNHIPDDDLERILAGWNACLATGEPWDNEHRVLGADGQVHWVLVRGLPVRDVEGRITGWVGINLALDERKRHEDQLTRHNEELQQLAYAVSHDLLEPLRTIGAYTQLLVRRSSDSLDPKSQELSDQILNAVERMRRMIADLLQYAQSTHENHAPSPIDVATVLQLAIDNLLPAMTESGAKVTHDSLLPARVDPDHLLHVFQNLIGNSIKYRSSVPPQIHVSSRADTDRCVFSVRDNGIGFEMKYAERIFRVFERLHSRSEIDGSGIGLATVKRIIERSDGKVWAESEPGRGSTFFFTLPLARDGE